LREAEKIGPATIALFEAIMKAKPHPEQGFRSCLGILSLVNSYGPERIGPRPGAATISAPPPTARSSRSCRTARSSLRQTEHAGRIPDPARQHPRAWLLPLSNFRMIACPREARKRRRAKKDAGEKKTE